MPHRLSDPMAAAPLFAGWQETLIWSCLQGVMGCIYADDAAAPRSAAAVIADFCFLAGTPSAELTAFRPPEQRRDFVILVPQNDAWTQTIRAVYGGTGRFSERYAIQKEPDVFDRARLQAAVDSLPAGYLLRPMDEKLYHICLRERWSDDLVFSFPSWQDYREWALGFVAMKDGRPAAGASTYTRYREGIEVEIDTHPDHRRRGLAYACGARLILACLDRGLYPSWDAHNWASAQLAQKLGYHFSHAYPTYELERR